MRRRWRPRYDPDARSGDPRSFVPSNRAAGPMRSAASTRREPAEGGGGARRDRTADLYNAIVALSRLSYGPGPRRTGKSLRGTASTRFGRRRERWWFPHGSNVRPIPYQEIALPAELGNRMPRPPVRPCRSAVRRRGRRDGSGWRTNSDLPPEAGGSWFFAVCRTTGPPFSDAGPSADPTKRAVLVLPRGIEPLFPL